MENIKKALVAGVGKIKHRIKRPVDPVKDKLKDGRKKIKQHYQYGVYSTQKNPIVKKIADISSSLLERDEEELLNNEESTFRKIRNAIVNGTFILTPFIIGLPIKMTDKAIQNNVDIKNAEKYDDVYEKEILFTENEIKKRKAAGNKAEDLKSYLKNLKKSRNKMKDYIEKIKESQKETQKESFTRTENDPYKKMILMDRSDYVSDDEYDNELIKTFENMISISVRKEYEIEEPEFIEESKTDNSDKHKSAYVISTGTFVKYLREDSEFRECTENVMGLSFHDFNEDKIDKLDMFNIDKKLKSKVESIVNEANNLLGYTNCKIIVTENDECLDITLEGIVQKAEDISRSVVHKARDIIPNESPMTKAERATSPLDDAVNKIIDSVKSALTHDKREEITKGRYRFKLVRIITKGIVYGGAYLIHPVLAAVAFLGKMYFDKRIDHQERSKITRDLESELEICKEKLKDAEEKGDKENKYKLMRIKKSLENELARIKLHMDK